MYEQKRAKRLTIMLTKAREKWKRPEWISPDTWTGLEAFWKSSYFLKSYNQSKINRASPRGKAVYSLYLRPQDLY